MSVVNTKAYAALLVLSLLATVGAVLTLIPAPGASYPNLLGYRSLCTFAPAATLYCAAIAGASCVIRASLVKRSAYSGRSAEFRTVPVVIVAVLLAGAIASNAWFVSVKSEYTDGTTAVTEQGAR